MSDNILQTLQHLVQDVIAPDVRELKVRLNSLEKQLDVRFDAVVQRFDGVAQRFNTIEQRFAGLDQKMDVQFNAILAAIAESKAQAEPTNLRVIASLSERIAVLEAQRH